MGMGYRGKINYSNSKCPGARIGPEKKQKKMCGAGNRWGNETSPTPCCPPWSRLIRIFRSVHRSVCRIIHRKTMTPLSFPLRARRFSRHFAAQEMDVEMRHHRRHVHRGARSIRHCLTSFECLWHFFSQSEASKVWALFWLRSFCLFWECSHCSQSLQIARM